MDGEQSVDEVLMDLLPGGEDGRVSVHDQPEDYHAMVPNPANLFDLLPDF